MKKYLLGLDLGTNSVGWCLTDENYNVVKKNGKSLWGVRLFEEAKTAAERRAFRSQRRRLQRRNERVDLLQSLFKEEIDKVDENFITRLNLSKFHFDDKKDLVNGVGVLFNDSNFDDKLFYSKYKSIYHLRNEMLNSDKKYDIRLVYLVMHHMVKYRGNFIYEGRNFIALNEKDFKQYIADLNDNLIELEKDKIVFDDAKMGKIKELISKEKSISKIKDSLKSIFNSSDKYVNNIIVPLISGGVVSVKNILEKDSDEDFEIKKISTRSATYEEDYSSLSHAFEDDPHIAILTIAKYISDFVLLGNMLSGKKTISEAMIEKFNNHKIDLEELKAYLKNDKQKYNKIFREVPSPKDEDLNNYVRYIGSNIIGNEQVRIKKCTKDNFYKFIKKELGINKESLANNPFFSDINQKMEAGTYLDKLNSTDNSAFPYQMNLNEMTVILEKQSKYYPFLTQTSSDGISTKDKIISLLTFRIPYYVGPLAYNKNNSEFSWIKKNEGKEKEKIYPWNFENIVNKDASAEIFIKRMLNKCTYLNDEYCLPKNSLVFSEYMVLSEINKIFINGNKITIDQKTDLIQNLYKKRKVTKKVLHEYFKTKYGKDVILSYESEKEIEEIKGNLSSFIQFSKLFGEQFVENNEDYIDSIINDITIFTDKKILERRLKKVYKIDDFNIIKGILSLSYTGYGRLSKKLLTGITTPFTNIATGEILEMSILQIMKNTNFNLMEILNNPEYTFSSQIEQLNYKDEPIKGKDFIKEYVNDLYVSPGMKRPIVQSYEIIEELKKIINHPIDEYYVECTRGEKEKIRSTSRKSFLLNLYAEAEKNCKDLLVMNNIDFKGLSNEINAIDESQFRSDTYFLYFLQFGRCMYSGKPIDLNLINNSSLYDIDHIVPQAIVKDDSIENRVLVNQELNKRKKDEFPINSDVKAGWNSRQFYVLLEKLNLMGKKKFNNLTRVEPLSIEELKNFVNRQLVFTNQAVDGLIKMINHFETIENKKPFVVFSKAENVSEFRKKFDILKCREANDFHHANDAYLNIVVGRTIDSYFKHGLVTKRIEEMKNNKESFNVMKIFDNYKNKERSPLLNLKNEIVWNYTNDETLKKVKNQVLNRFDILVTTRQYISHSLFNKISIHPGTDSDGSNLFPMKNKKNGIEKQLSDTKKYGGYNDISGNYYCLVKGKNKGKEITRIIPMPIIYVKPEESNLKS